VGSDADGGIDGSGVVHDALFVFDSSIIMDDDTTHVAAGIGDGSRRRRRFVSIGDCIAARHGP